MWTPSTLVATRVVTGALEVAAEGASLVGKSSARQDISLLTVRGYIQPIDFRGSHRELCRALDQGGLDHSADCPVRGQDRRWEAKRDQLALWLGGCGVEVQSRCGQLLLEKVQPVNVFLLKQRYPFHNGGGWFGRIFCDHHVTFVNAWKILATQKCLADTQGNKVPEDRPVMNTVNLCEANICSSKYN